MSMLPIVFNQHVQFLDGKMENQNKLIVFKKWCAILKMCHKVPVHIPSIQSDENSDWLAFYSVPFDGLYLQFNFKCVTRLVLIALVLSI